MSPDEKRLRLIEAAAVLLDVAKNRRLNTVSLNKALFYLDLASLRDCGETFTRNSYVALPHGPVVAKYPERLIEQLEKDGIAKQSVAGLACPVSLVKLPGFRRITPEVKELAEKVSRWCSDKSSTELSRFSHDNPGWIVAFEDEKYADGIKQVIDMNIAMQQIVDSDPWMSQNDDVSSRAACEAADTTEGEPW